MKYLTAFVAVLLMSGSALTPALAHDFWLYPSPFMMEKPGDTIFKIRIGHAADMQDWPINPDRVVSFRQYGPGGLTDLQAGIKRDRSGRSGYQIKSFQPESNGLYMIAIETSHALSELPAEPFNAYVEEEGLSPILKARERDGQMDKSGREIYSRRGKALLQVGDLPETDPDYVLKPLGMTLEIVPIENPYRVKPGEMMDFQVNFRGAPLRGAQVALVSLDTVAGDVAEVMSDAKGQVSFKRPSAGDWMVHTVWSDSISEHPLADFDTTFSSLSFGF